jgi:cytochrome c biogenesis protein ResB
MPIGSSSDGTSFYIADYGNNKIRRINIASGEVTTLAGPSQGTTTAGDTDNATASNARFTRPVGMTTDGTNLYVTEEGNNKIRKIVISSGAVTTFAGPPAGTTTSGSTDNATASNARFNKPFGMTTDGINLYVSDVGNNKIRKIVISSGAVTTIAGPPAGTTTSGDTDNDTASNARFNSPYGLSSDGSYLYVGDYSNNKIRRIE